MRAVLYAYDLEPITIIDVPMNAVEYLKKHGLVRIHAPTMPRTTFPLSEPIQTEFKQVTIKVSKLLRRVANFMCGGHYEPRNAEAGQLVKEIFKTVGIS